ncbi:hypothetical protein EUX98_g3034 [Antrodiella citrinella]|uniref:F-box domain-containing protein n=1 Tax=Antrodiella citrinella TaxID=2447956 RepID=A0A4S4N5V5_9APHY|nr:hypothetical protein EUX98_g3034 [Antrodiella citrinella]
MVFLTSLTLPTFLLQHSDDPTATHEALCVIFRKAVRLQKLILGTNLDIGEGIWQALAGLPVLVHLDIRSLISRFSLTEKLSFSTTLVALRIEPPRLDYLLTAFQHSSFPFLQEINCIIFRRQQANHAIVDRFIKAVAKSCSANALRKFHLRCSDYWSSADEHELADAVGSKALSHLFCMHDMREFYVDVGWTWDLGDEFIRDLSQAWPELTWLHLDPRGRWMYPLRITFHGLQSLATYCPRLIRLGIIFDTSPLDMPPLLLPPPAERCMLYELNVGPCKLESPGSFARFLSRIFPCLSSIMFYQYDWDKNALEPRDIQQWYQADFILRDMVMRVTDDSVDSLAEVVTHTHL